MKAGRWVWIQIYGGILFLVAGVVLNGALALKAGDMNGRYGFGKVTASLSNQLDPARQRGLTVYEARRLEQYIGDGGMTYCAKAADNSHVSFEERAYQAQILGVNCLYPEFIRLKMLQGSFWNPSGDSNAQPVAVIDQDLAWNIFKSANVSGRVLRLFNHPVRIIGVIARDDSLFAWLTDSGTPKLYVPAATLLSLDPHARITELEWQTPENSTLDLNKAVLTGALQKTGKNPADYQIIDWNIKRVIIAQKPRLLTFCTGLLVMWLLLRYLRREIQITYLTLKEACRYDYLRKVLTRHRKVIGITALKTVFCLSAIWLLWLGCVFKPYIPPRYIPDELTNMVYYFDLFRDSIRTGVAALGYIPSHPEQVLHRTEMITNGLFVLGLAGGLPLLYSGFTGFKKAGTSVDRIMLGCGLGMLGSVFVIAFSARLVGVPLVIDMRSIVIIWTLVFGKTLSIKRKTGSLAL